MIGELIATLCNERTSVFLLPRVAGTPGRCQDSSTWQAGTATPASGMIPDRL